jgi:hypothetical protein
MGDVDDDGGTVADVADDDDRHSDRVVGKTKAFAVAASASCTIDGVSVPIAINR